MKYFDLHCDTFSKIFEESKTLSDPNLAVNLDGFGSSEIYLQQFAVYLSGKEINPKAYYKSVLLKGISELNKFNIPIIKTKKNLEAYSEKSGVAALLAVEGGWFIECEKDVENLYNDGIRTVSLCWNYDTPLAGGALENGGLTAKGKEVIKCLNRYNIALDVSHLNRTSFFQAAEVADSIIATHSGIAAIIKHKRNLTDDQLSLIKDKNGIIGLCFYPAFAGAMPVNGIIRAVEHALDLGLDNNLALGSDFDGADMADELRTVNNVPSLYKKMSETFSKQTVSKIFFENSYNFYSKVLTNT